MREMRGGVLLDLGNTIHCPKRGAKVQPRIDTSSNNNNNDNKLNKKTTKERQRLQPAIWRQLANKIVYFVTLFSKTTSVHGIMYMMNRGLHFVERLMWLACFCGAIFGCTSLAQRTWSRYQTSPMVISMDRNKFFWNTSFPSLTVCPHKRIDDSKLADYMDIYPTRFPNETIRVAFTEFITKLANVTYETIHELPKDQEFGIDSNDYLDLIWNLTWRFLPDVSSGTGVKVVLQDTITEVGLCYSFNSKLSVYNSYSYWKQNRWDTFRQNETITAHPLDGEIYAQIINLSCSYDVYFHGSMEVLDVSQQRYSFGSQFYATVNLLAQEILTADNAKDLSVSQRQCRFTNEADTLFASPVYSYNLCQIECRMRMALKFCNCIPHFYRSNGKRGQRFPVCDLRGLMCLLQIKDELISLKLMQIECNCMANCDDSSFFVQDSRSRVWFLGANLQWGYNDYPKMQLKRNLIFGFTDVLVYIGGMAGFFLGCSLLSFTEFVYYFSWRVVQHCLK